MKRGVQTALRDDRPDGTALEMVHDDRGRLTTTRIGSDRSTLVRSVAEFAAHDATRYLVAPSDEGVRATTVDWEGRTTVVQPDEGATSVPAEQ